MANRTKAGNVTAEARKKHGTSGGRFPIFDRRSALAALRLRGHAKNAGERASIIRRAAKYAAKEAAAAREADAKK